MSDTEHKKKLVVGVKQTMRMLEKGMVSNIYVAEDADFFVTRTVIEAATAADIPIIPVESKKELGRMCGIEIGTATAGTLI